MKPETSQLVEVCRTIGQKVPLWTQGAGGNVSVKTATGELLIKASGLRLDAVTERSGWVLFDYRKFLHQWEGIQTEEDYSAALGRCNLGNAEGTARPSMESGMHALLPRPWVMHFHSLAALLMAHELIEQPQAFADWFSRTAFGSLCSIGQQMPGLQLTDRLASDPEPGRSDFILLQNHGVVLHGESDPLQLLRRWSALEEAFLQRWGYAKAWENSLIPETPLEETLHFPDSAVFQAPLKQAIKTFNDHWVGKRGKIELSMFGPNPVGSELAWASALLQIAQPKLAALQAEIENQVGTLPTEIFRKGQS